MTDPEFEFLAPAGFEWDEDKSEANLIKHGIDFADASEVFLQTSCRLAVVTTRSDGSRSENLMIKSYR
jgi:uncharacterized DUF497 family protein